MKTHKRRSVNIFLLGLMIMAVFLFGNSQLQAQDGDYNYSTAGTYGSETGTDTINDNVTISADGVILQNTVITGDLTITEAVGDGDVTLINDTVNGTTTINGGGYNSIKIDNCKLGIVIINKADGHIRLVLSGATTITEIIANSAVTVEGEATIAKATINSAGVVIEANPGIIVVASGISATVNGRTVVGSTSGGSGGGSSGGGGGGATTSPTVSYPVKGGQIQFNTATGTITGYTGSPTDVVIPSSISGVNVTGIGNAAFYNCTGLTTAEIPQSVTSIGFRAFAGCSSLNIITFHSATTTIYDDEDTIPTTTKIIGYEASTANNYAAEFNRTFKVFDSAANDPGFIPAPAIFGIITDIASETTWTDGATVRYIKLMKQDGKEYSYPICGDTFIEEDNVSTCIKDMSESLGEIDCHIISRSNLTSTAINAEDEKLVAVNLETNGMVGWIEVFNQADIASNIAYSNLNVDTDYMLIRINGRWYDAAGVVVFKLNNGTGGVAVAIDDLSKTSVGGWDELENTVGKYVAWYSNSNGELKYVVINTSGGGTGSSTDECFIATAAFGSKFTWPVALLRHFRDQYLLTNSWGTAFVNFYYKHSPPIAAMIAADQPLKMLVRVLLAPVIALIYLMYHPLLMVTGLLIMFLIYRYRLRRRCVQS